MLKKLFFEKNKNTRFNAVLKTALVPTVTAVALIVMPGTSQSALASLTGDTIEGELQFGSFPLNFFDPQFGTVPGTAGPQPITTVGSGIEFQYQDSFSGLNVDFTDDALFVEQFALTGGGLAGAWTMTFSDLDWVDFPDGRIVGLELLPNPGLNAIPGLDLSFTDDSITLNFAGGNLPSDGFSTNIGILTDHQSVPEPLTILGTIAAGGIGVLMKRKTANSSDV